MRLPPQRKILREDIKDPPPWIGAVIEPMNSFMEFVYQMLNRNITLTENIASFIREVTYKTPSTYPTGVEVSEFNNAIKARPIGVQILQIYEKDTYLPPPGPCYVPWVELNNVIKIYPITGLEADKTYLIRLVVF